MPYVDQEPVETGQLITPADINRWIDNIDALKNPPSASYEFNHSANWTTSGGSFADVDATRLSLTITTTGGDVMIGFHGNCGGSQDAQVFFDVALDGTRIGGDDGIVTQRIALTAAVPASFVRLKTGVSAGSHTFKLQWKVNAGTATLWAGAGTSGRDLHGQFWVREVS